MSLSLCLASGRWRWAVSVSCARPPALLILESFALTLEMGLPILAQSALVVFNVRSAALHGLCTLLMLAPAVHLLFHRRERTRRAPANCVGICRRLPSRSHRCPSGRSAGAQRGALPALPGQRSCSIGTTPSTARPGVFTAVAGLALWGLVYPLDMILGRYNIAHPLLVAAVPVSQLHRGLRHDPHAH